MINSSIEPIEVKNVAKYFEEIIDNKLIWEKHIHDVLQKLSKFEDVSRKNKTFYCNFDFK